MLTRVVRPRLLLVLAASTVPLVLLGAGMWRSGASLKSSPPEQPAAEGAEARPASLARLATCAERSVLADRMSCYARILESHARLRSPAGVLADLDTLQKAHLAFRTHCHDMAHVLGRLWIAQGRSVADGFARGSNICHSGFFHGMVERVMRGEAAAAAEPEHIAPDELRAKIPAVCTAESLGSESRNLRFQCLHGLGHAVVFSLVYRVPLALELCDLLPDSWSRESCYGGVFMENITGLDRARRMLRTGDPHYPCSVVSSPYRKACYLMQTSWMLEDGLDTDRVAAACRTAGRYRLPCFRSLGRDLSPRVRESGPSGLAELCMSLPSDERKECVLGALYALADHTWDGTYAYPFCAAFSSAPVGERCFSEAHGYLRGQLEQSFDTLAANCRASVPEAAECLTFLEAREKD